MNFSTKIYALISVFASLFSQVSWAGDTVFSVDILGHSYELVVQENVAFAEKIASLDSITDSKHYSGYVNGVDQSWVRVSNIDNRWQGVVSLYGEMYVVKDGAIDLGNASLAQSFMRAEPINQHSDLAGTCGAEGHDHSVLENVSTSFSQQSQANAAQKSSSLPTLAATFADFCSQQVNGICVIAEVEVAFDLQFQALFGAQANAQALSILNIVDGHYTNDLNIAIDTLTVEMLTSNLFNTTTNAGDLLDDIQFRKDNGQIPFITNNSAITHLVTGRNLDGATLGIAHLGSVCFSDGQNTSLSSVALIGGLPDPVVTAVVVAHELGHNLGSLHDGPAENAACPSGQFIMSPVIGPGITNFSVCSALDIETTLSNLPNPGQCLDFPADVIVTEDPGNNGELDVNNEFVLAFTATLNSGFAAIQQISINGNIDLDDAILVSVTANGGACAVAGDGGGYNCVVNNLSGQSVVNLLARIRVDLNANMVALSQVATEQTADVQDINLANNTLVSQFSVAGTTIASTADPNSLTSSSNVGGNSGFTVNNPIAADNSIDGDNGDDGGGGGGGAFEVYLILGLLMLCYSRRYV